MSWKLSSAYCQRLISTKRITTTNGQLSGPLPTKAISASYELFLRQRQMSKNVISMGEPLLSSLLEKTRVTALLHFSKGRQTQMLEIIVVEARCGLLRKVGWHARLRG